MLFQGQIRKMISENGNPIQYYLNFSDDFLSMNQLINRTIRISFDHYECLGCHQDVEIYRMGYCRNCFFTLPQANESIIRPELSTAHLGIEKRDLKWEQEFELQPHIVYLSNTSGVKVGVTRAAQLPTRWIDQGATEAMIIARTENRYQAGMIEVALKEHLADKTNYQRMLKNEQVDDDLQEVWQSVRGFVGEEQQPFLVEEQEVYRFDYPVTEYPTKIKVINLSKEPSFEGKLLGIKGQYLIFDENRVFNVRNHEGFYLQFSV